MTGPTVAVDLGEYGVAGAVEHGGEVTELGLELAAVLAPDDGDALVTGREARRRAAADPSRFEPAPRRHVDEPTILLGSRVVGIGEALGAVLTATVDRAAPALRGARPGRVVLTHPASWGTSRREVLRRAGSGLGAELVLLPEPLAVAAHAAWMRPGSASVGPVAVLDVGTRTARAAVVAGPDPVVVAERTAHGCGGDEADELLLAAVLATWPEGAAGADRLHEVVTGATLPDRRHRQVLIEDVRAARERLSDAEQAEIPLPGGASTAWCSRGELEDVLSDPCERLVGLLAAALDDAGVEPARLAGLRVVGGLARTPLLGTLVHRELGIPPVVPPEPRGVVARGALLALARREGAGARNGVVGPGSAIATRGGPARPSEVSSRRGLVGSVAAGRGGSPDPGPAPLPGWPRPDASRPAPPSALAGPAAATPAAPLEARAVPWPLPPGPPALGTGPTAPVPPSRPPLDRDTGSYPVATDPVATDPDGPTRRIAHPLVPASRARARTETPGGSTRWTPRRRAAVIAAVTVTVAAVVLAVAGLRGTGGGSATAAAPTVVSAFAHAYELPAGWAPDGTDATARRSRVRPVDQPRGPNLVAVQESPLASGDPQSARAQLLAGFTAVRGAGGGVSDLTPDTSFGGRPVAATYRQLAAPGTSVEWVVLFTGATQLSVGCRYDDGGRAAVLAACARVVSTLRSPP